MRGGDVLTWCTGQPQQLEEEAETPRWAFFSPEAYSRAWSVPWGARTVIGGMSLWAVSFLVVGIVLLPLIGYSFGIKVCHVQLSVRSEALSPPCSKQGDRHLLVLDSAQCGYRISRRRRRWTKPTSRCSIR